MQYTLYVDESGDAGIKTVRTSVSQGASRYMVLGGVLVPNSQRARILSDLEKLAELFGRPELHCTKLNHNQIVRFATDIAERKILCFAVASFKETLGQYSKDIDQNHKQYYHKCLQYLLECVGQAAQEFGIAANQIDICIENGVVDIGPLKKFIGNCRETPINARAKNLWHIDPHRIVAKEKFEEPLLQLPDLVAHALYRCLEKTKGNFGVLERRYLSALKNRFYHRAKDGTVIDWGIKPIHSVGQLGVPLEMKRFFSQFRVDVKKSK